MTTELSDREKEVLWHYGFRGLPVKRVARRLGITEETTKSYIKRFREKLRARVPEPVDVDSRVDLYWAALVECESMPLCQAARDEVLIRLLNLRDEADYAAA